MSQNSDTLAAVARLHHAGRFDEALAACRRILVSDPQNVDALGLMGAIRGSQGQVDEALAHINQALKIRPNHSPTHDALGVLFAKQGRISEAIDCFQRAIAFDPAATPPLFNLATARFQAGEIDGALESLQKVLRLEPNSRRAHAGVALTLARQNRLTDAIPHLRALTRLSPRDPHAHFELAGALYGAGELDEAVECYRQSLALEPNSAECCTGLAGVLIEQAKCAEAVTLCEQALRLKPDFFDAHFSLGMARLKQEKHELARSSLAEAARINPDSAEAQVNMGIALANLSRYDEAVQCFHWALAAQQVNAETLHNLGLTLVQLRRLDEALEVMDQSLTLEPENPEGHYNRSTVLFFLGRLREAFTEYEWRFKTRQAGPIALRWPEWDGSSLSGRSIVLCGEQGFGDTFQFIRFAKVLHDQGARVTVQIMERMHPILKGASGVDACISPKDAPPPADCGVALMSVPHRLGIELDTIPAPIPYLFADPQLVESWKSALAECREFRVGIVWQGNPSIGGDRNRSIPLTNYAPLAAVKGVRLVNLQKGPGFEQLAAVKTAWNILDLGPTVDSDAGAFMDSAAIMRNLDLVISSDTSAAHLAGGLGVPVWLALEYIPDWRWLLDREDCPWYPTMKVFRQRQRGDWAELFARMAADLTGLVAART